MPPRPQTLDSQRDVQTHTEAHRREQTSEASGVAEYRRAIQCAALPPPLQCIQCIQCIPCRPNLECWQRGAAAPPLRAIRRPLPLSIARHQRRGGEEEEREEGRRGRRGRRGKRGKRGYVCTCGYVCDTEVSIYAHTHEHMLIHTVAEKLLEKCCGSLLLHVWGLVQAINQHRHVCA